MTCAWKSASVTSRTKAEAGAPQDAHDARALLEAQALLGHRDLAERFKDLLPSLGAGPERFVSRFHLLEDLP